MKKVKFFVGIDISSLEHEVNEWLSNNKDVEVLETNLSSFSKAATLSQPENNERYAFYILYSSLNSAVAEVKAMIAEEKSSIEATDINPAVMKATN